MMMKLINLLGDKMGDCYFYNIDCHLNSWFHECLAMSWHFLVSSWEGLKDHLKHLIDVHLYLFYVIKILE